MLLSNIQRNKRRFSYLSSFSSRAPVQQQQMQLYRLLYKARNTALGKQYRFNDILLQKDPYALFRAIVPITDYDQFYQKWLHRALLDEPNVTWPGIVPYYALSSGTSGAASKYVPVTHDLLNSMSKAVLRSFMDLFRFKVPPKQLLKSTLMIGSSTALRQEGLHQVGDLSGIMALNRPLWLEPYYRPGRTITDLTDWEQRIEAIVQQAHQWDIGLVVGNPMWVQMVLERLIEKHNLQHIHQLWPNFRFYAHSGVYFEPYRPAFEQLLGQPVMDADIYLASEGYFGYQTRPGRPLRLLKQHGIFYEFVPCTPENFDEEGNLRPNAVALDLTQVEPDTSYALVLSTNAGLWRYLLGDTISFTNTLTHEFRITGRTKLFLSVCGEHVSMDNLNEAVRCANIELSAGVREFAVAGMRDGAGWKHQWWVSLDNTAVTTTRFAHAVDTHLQRLNDDYALERQFSLKTVDVQWVKNDQFYQWLALQGKSNGQTKVPRVLKGAALEHWLGFIGQ